MAVFEAQAHRYQLINCGRSGLAINTDRSNTAQIRVLGVTRASRCSRSGSGVRALTRADTEGWLCSSTVWPPLQYCQPGLWVTSRDLCTYRNCSPLKKDRAKLLDLSIFILASPPFTVFFFSFSFSFVEVQEKLNALSYFNRNNRQPLNRNCACLPFLDLLCWKTDAFRARPH